MQGLNTASYNSASLTGYYKNIEMFRLKSISPITIASLAKGCHGRVGQVGHVTSLRAPH
jgi:hypothetical protein